MIICRLSIIWLSIAFLFATPVIAIEKADFNIYPTAIFAFSEKGAGVRDLGKKVSDVLFASLLTSDKMYLVDRDEMSKLMGETTLNLSGMVNPQQAIQIGQLTGARLLITGNIFEIDGRLMIVAKIIGTETSRVIGASVTGDADDDLLTLVDNLAKKIIQQIDRQSDKLVAKKVTRDDQLATLKQNVKGTERPTVSIDIDERHVGNSTLDPAAETEIGYYLAELGFPLIAKNTNAAKNADIQITGEGFSEFATRHGDIVSVKARLEVKVVERKSSRVLHLDRQVAVEVDLTEHIAGKKALQKAAAEIAFRLAPKLTDQIH